MQAGKIPLSYIYKRENASCNSMACNLESTMLTANCDEAILGRKWKSAQYTSKLN